MKPILTEQDPVAALLPATLPKRRPATDGGMARCRDHPNTARLRTDRQRADSQSLAIVGCVSVTIDSTSVASAARSR